MKRKLLLLLIFCAAPLAAQDAALKKAMSRELAGHELWGLRVGGNWALTGWTHHEAEGMALFHRYPGGWELAQAGGGAMGAAELAILGVPASERKTLIPNLSAEERQRVQEVLGKPYWTWLTDKAGLQDSDLENYTAWELTLMRNEIFARHGRAFRDAELNAYFRQRPWYRPDSGYSDARLSPVQKRNASHISQYQRRSGKL